MFINKNPSYSRNWDYRKICQLISGRFILINIWRITLIYYKFNPKLQISSNWAYSSYMPGPIDANVDFLSGDILDDNLINVEFEAGVMAAHHKPWDLMIWGFMGDKNGQGYHWKPAKMLQQKVSSIIAQGGGYSIYINQNRDASIPLSTVPFLKSVADYGKLRKPYSFKAEAIPQIALLMSVSGHNYDLGLSTAFNQNNGGNDNIKGTLAMLLNSGYAVQVVQEHDVNRSFRRFPLLVITEWNYLDKGLVSKIEDYVRNGGNLLLIGAVTCNIFNTMLKGKGPYCQIMQWSIMQKCKLPCF